VRPLKGFLMMHSYELSKNGARWVNGQIHNPEDGVSYRSILEPGPDDALKVKVCLEGEGLLGMLRVAWGPFARRKPGRGSRRKGGLRLAMKPYGCAQRPSIWRIAGALSCTCAMMALSSTPSTLLSLNTTRPPIMTL
jgi:hypothetical protein